ncbi:MAG TPA: hypothetical protein VEW45_04905 [Candidatus Dormibacteraeota bacterium]|nr:hypothetical protein [Candidatus Dormibacteraeota bacterium]
MRSAAPKPRAARKKRATPASEAAPKPRAAPASEAAPKPRAASAREAAPEPDSAPEPELERPIGAPALIEVFTDEARLFAEVDLSGERLSDVLNREDEVQAFSIDRGTNGSTPHQSIALSVESILLAIAPPQPSYAARRLHRPRHWVEIKIGGHEVLGNLHVPAGAQPDGYLVRVNPKFVALTEAEIHTDRDDWRTEVVLVNMRQVDSLTEVSRGPDSYAYETAPQRYDLAE